MFDEEVIKFKNSKEWLEFINYYSDKSFTEQLGMFRYEDVHTNFLASLLDGNNIYGYGIKPMQLFLELIKVKNNNEKKIEYLESVDLLSIYEIDNLNINVRKKLATGIPDLYITFDINQNNESKKYLLILEAKFDTTEHDNQCDNYYDAIKDLDYCEKIFLYLTLDGGECSSDYYNIITYQDLIDYVYTPLIYNKTNNIALTIEEYLKSFNSIYEMEYKDIKCYPITPKGKKLTINLWKYVSSMDSLWEEKEGLWKILYERDYKFKFFLINILKLRLIDGKDYEKLNSYLGRMTSKIYFDNEELKISEGIYTIIKSLINYYNFKSIEDIDSRVIVTTGKWKNIVAESKFDESISPDKKHNYKISDDLILNDERYYYVVPSRVDIENLNNALKECYPDFAKKVSIKPYISKDDGFNI